MQVNMHDQSLVGPVMSFMEWCNDNGFSASTGRRVIKSGKGPRIIKLSERRIGITTAENLRWRASRMINSAT
jgi:predicted DNA-binding transcriptional regulator AlpA